MKENVTQGFRFYKLKDRKNGSMRTKVKTVVSSWCGEAVDCGIVMFLHLLPKYPTAVEEIPLQQQGPCLIHSVPAVPSPEPKTQQESGTRANPSPAGTARDSCSGRRGASDFLQQLNTGYAA